MGARGGVGGALVRRDGNDFHGGWSRGELDSPVLLSVSIVRRRGEILCTVWREKFVISKAPETKGPEDPLIAIEPR